MKNIWSKMLLIIAFCTCFTGAASSQNVFPSKPIRFIVPFPAGGGTDIVGRTFATYLAKSTGGTIVVDNRAGAGGMLSRNKTSEGFQSNQNGMTSNGLITEMHSFFVNAWPACGLGMLSSYRNIDKK